MSLLWLAVLPLAGGAPILSLDFASSDGGMLSANGLQWQWAEITAGPDDFTGPAWATHASGDYLNDAMDTLGLPSLDLSGVDRPVLVLEHWYEIDQSGDGDLGWLEVLDGGSFTLLTPIHGYPEDEGFAGSSGTFRTDYFDLSGIDQAASIRLVFDSDATVTRHGWVVSGLWIDDGDPVPPVIEGVTELENTQDISGPYVVHAEVSDDFLVSEVNLWWSTESGASSDGPMENVGASLYRGEIPGVNPGTRVTWWISASDGTNHTTWPAEGKAEFNVFLAAPTDLLAPQARIDGRVEGLEVALQWSAPNSPHDLVHTVLLRDGEVVGTSPGETGSIPLISARHDVSVAGVFMTPAGRFQGEATPELPLSVALPTASRLLPAHGYQGDTMHLQIRGVNLLLAEDQVALHLGGVFVVTRVRVFPAP